MNSAGERPDPDQLLATVQAEETRARRGRLRIFFGASAGVGKTYAMLEAARVERAAGRDIIVGYVEPHGRQETERLMEGLEQLPVLPVRYRSAVRQEFDLDAALRRRPEIVLVDELAHSNLVEGEPAPRHAKRWQDIEELLDAGINVWTTVNVQHLESLNDLVAQITGVRQRETIPDRIFDEADEVELIDLPPDDLACAPQGRQGLSPGAGRRRRRTLLPQGQPARAARDCAAPHGRSRRRGGAGCARDRLRHPALARARPPAGRGRAGLAGRAAGARGQTAG